MIYEMRYLIDTIYLLPGALSWYGYDPLSFLKITSMAQLEVVLKFGMMLGVLDWFIGTIVVHYFFFSSASCHSDRSDYLLDVLFKAPIKEEVLFRLIGITGIYQLTGSLSLAVILTSVAFSVNHWGRGVHRLPDTFIAGLIYSFAFLWGGLPAAIVAHATNNWLDTFRWFF